MWSAGEKTIWGSEYRMIARSWLPLSFIAAEDRRGGEKKGTGHSLTRNMTGNHHCRGCGCRQVPVHDGPGCDCRWGPESCSNDPVLRVWGVSMTLSLSTRKEERTFFFLKKITIPLLSHHLIGDFASWGRPRWDALDLPRRKQTVRALCGLLSVALWVWFLKLDEPRFCNRLCAHDLPILCCFYEDTGIAATENSAACWVSEESTELFIRFWFRCFLGWSTVHSGNFSIIICRNWEENQSPAAHIFLCYYWKNSIFRKIF